MRLHLRDSVHIHRTESPCLIAKPYSLPVSRSGSKDCSFRPQECSSDGRTVSAAETVNVAMTFEFWSEIPGEWTIRGMFQNSGNRSVRNRHRRLVLLSPWQEFRFSRRGPAELGSSLSRTSQAPNSSLAGVAKDHPAAIGTLVAFLWRRQVDHASSGGLFCRSQF